MGSVSSSPRPNQQKQATLERTKFVLIPDLDVDENKQRLIRDKWVKSLRLATKGAFLWDVLLKLSAPTTAAQSHSQNGHHSEYPMDEHSHLPTHSMSAKRSMHKKRSSHSLSVNSNRNQLHHHHVIHPHQHKGSDILINHSPRNQASNAEFTYKKRAYKRDVGGNTQDYADYNGM